MTFPSFDVNLFLEYEKVNTLRFRWYVDEYR